MTPPFVSDRNLWSKIAAVLLAINLIFWVGSTLFASRIVTDPIVTPAPTPDLPVDALVPSPTPAVQAFLWWNSEIAIRDLAVARYMRFNFVKQTFPWREIEVHKGEFVWAQADRVVVAAETKRILLIARLDSEPGWARDTSDPAVQPNGPPADYQDFGDYCYAVASRYQGRAIKAYQVWNEPNLAREWGGKPPDPNAYAQLLKACYEGIKRGDPQAIVISAGMAPTGTGLPEAMPDDEFIRAMYAAGASQYFDMLGVNAPGYKAPPQTSPDEVEKNAALGGYRWACFRHVEDIRQIMVEQGDAGKQLAILEMGWTTDTIHPDYSWFAVTPNQQAEYLAGAYWWARQNWQPWIGFMTTIYLADPAWTEDDEEYWWSITKPGDGDAKLTPAFYALQGLPQWEPEFYDALLPPQP